MNRMTGPSPHPQKTFPGYGDCKATERTSFGVSKLRRRLHRLGNFDWQKLSSLSESNHEFDLQQSAQVFSDDATFLEN